MNVSSHALAAGLLVAGLTLSGGRFASGQVIFIDGFEKGVPVDTLGVGTDVQPWLTDTPTRSFYDDKPAEFDGGFVVAHLLDDTAQGTQGMRAGSPDLADGIGGQVSTTSFDFMEVGGTSLRDGWRFGYTIGFPGIPEPNSLNKTFVAYFDAGTLDVSGDSDEGGAIAYPTDQVHTFFMVVNETDNPVVDYRDGQTLDPQEADVWLQLNGSDDPVFVFSILHNDDSIGIDSRYFAFRSYGGDMAELFVDNMLVVPGASFDRDFDFGNRIPGDVNNDKIVDRLDYDIIRNHFFEAVASREDGDVTEDGFVDYLDYRQWKDAYVPPGTGAAALTSPVPEPRSAVLLGLATIGWLLCRFSRVWREGCAPFANE